MDLTGIERTLHQIAAEYTIFFSSTHGTLSKIHHMLSHKMTQQICKIKIILSIFFKHNVMKLQIN